MAAKRKAKNINSVSRGIEREIMKQNGSLMRSRGRHEIHTSRAEKRRSRLVDRKRAINEGSD